MLDMNDINRAPQPRSLDLPPFHPLPPTPTRPRTLHKGPSYASSFGTQAAICDVNDKYDELMVRLNDDKV